MFLFGFLVGAAAATVFILYGDGDLLIRLGEQMKRSAARFWLWQRERGTPK
ncbi:MAG: hypothetical protein ACRERD_26940 [Candidatus Binatia bacterium]